MTPARRLHEEEGPQPAIVEARDVPGADAVAVAAGTGDPTGILLVDDHRENLAALEAVLEPLGEPLISVDSGEEALRVLLHREVAVILLDVRMAGIDGVETARIIRSRLATRHIPIIFLTALVSDVEEIARAYATGAVDYVIKPFEPSILRAKVRVFVSLSRERSERLRESRGRARAEAATRAVRTLQELSDAALAHLELEPLAEELLERACALYQASAGALLLVEEGELRQVAGRGEAIAAADGFAELLVAPEAALLRPGQEGWPTATPGELAQLVAIPLPGHEGASGLLLLGATDEAAVDEADLELLGLAADRIAIAIEHARRFEHERELVEALQLSLLPERLPEHPRLELAARYLPSGSGAHIGGDWYDALQLDHNRFALIIGDVVGHGIRAAARMGELRNALRAYATEGHSPGVALHRLDGLVKATVGSEMVATVIFAVLDLADGTVTLARAGHPPALVRSADGEVRQLETGRTLPLGLIGATVPTELTHQLAPGETLLLYTDGLVERRGETIDGGIERLAATLASSPVDAEEACAALVRALIHEERPSRDDVALLAVRLCELAPGRLHLTLPAVSGSIPVARHALRGWLGINVPELDEIARGDFEVGFSEACTNVVRHAYGPGDATFAAGAERDGAAIVLTVEDQGRWRPPRGEHGGRGLTLMRAMCDELSLDKHPQGTVVQMRWRLDESRSIGRAATG